LFIDELGSYRWSIQTIAISNLIFAALLYLSTIVGNNTKSNKDMTILHAVGIGIWQIFSAISGASRSGTAITGALFFGFRREDAAKFSILLSIPTIMGALVFIISKNSILNEDSYILDAFIPFLTTFIVSYFCIKWFISFVKRVGYLPFIIYRVVLGVLLLWLI
jgi:undecaprenyl-diphosphatase